MIATSATDRRCRPKDQHHGDPMEPPHDGQTSTKNGEEWRRGASHAGPRRKTMRPESLGDAHLAAHGPPQLLGNADSMPRAVQGQTIRGLRAVAACESLMRCPVGPDESLCLL